MEGTIRQPARSAVIFAKSVYFSRGREGKGGGGGKKRRGEEMNGPATIRLLDRAPRQFFLTSTLRGKKKKGEE